MANMKALQTLAVDRLESAASLLGDARADLRAACVPVEHLAGLDDAIDAAYDLVASLNGEV